MPKARSGHSCVAYQNKLFVFGGIFEVTKELNDCHVYDIATNQWKCIFDEKSEDGAAQSPTKIRTGAHPSNWLEDKPEFSDFFDAPFHTSTCAQLQFQLWNPLWAL